jgi:hypothetical protein
VSLFLALHQQQSSIDGFMVVDRRSSRQSSSSSSSPISSSSTHLLAMAADKKFQMTVSMPPTDSGIEAQLRFEPVLSVPSEMVEIRYKIPFGLDVEPQNNLAVCTKDGAGGERAGDVLRFTSRWTLGVPRGDGLVTTAAFFAGGVSWQCSMFDVAKAASWEEVVEALTSNVASRTDEVVLLFERPLEKTE